ncbi:signal recognition particle receptor subunit alpha homolog [Daktulosphaira vitifoliae]|uniref:signal recognition particle receptor subunit alpha homolog n=1 Tax=Daktulosphaira vitifoliae TaxID=58002 RepID=UPI0021A9A731|nr:signal recognition particle receptor subunit alpha homolog [Daktulosphaira vitifoliae]
MLDLFTIFSKGGIVLWCFQSTSQISQLFVPSVNSLIKTIILQERTGSNNNYTQDSLSLKYRLDNEFDLVFVIAFQKILQLSYVDKFLDDIQLEFRDKYKNDLSRKNYFMNFEFTRNFHEVLKSAEEWGKIQANIPKQMRSYNESIKSKKTVASMIEKKGENDKENKKNGKVELQKNGISDVQQNIVTFNDEDIIAQNRFKMAQKMGAMNSCKLKKNKDKTLKPSPKAAKQPRTWPLGGNVKDVSSLDYTKDKANNNPDSEQNIEANNEIVGQMEGNIKDIEIESDSEIEDSGEEEKFETAADRKKKNDEKKSVFSMFKGLVGRKNLTASDMDPVLEKLREHLASKNVAIEIATKLCDSVSSKLDGKVLGSFESVASTVKTTMIESLVQILSPKRRVDILRDAMTAKQNDKPYVITFCGVNGVGKSTNLAKICFWLIENNLRVLIAACDTFRAGAVEQLRTHTKHLNALHPAKRHNNQQMVQLYEKGYGKDAAGIANEAINYAKEAKYDVVLVDTAGRMQDNEPLMRALTKLIKVNEPDMVLFVGEALVGNEAVDQLVKFNQALADYSSSENPHLIDGIVLTKFDTIDDKVGAAISMTYITGQPIVFVGTGQTYTDLKSLNAKAVVAALMK